MVCNAKLLPMKPKRRKNLRRLECWKPVHRAAVGWSPAAKNLTRIIRSSLLGLHWKTLIVCNKPGLIDDKYLVSFITTLQVFKVASFSKILFRIGRSKMCNMKAECCIFFRKDFLLRFNFSFYCHILGVFYSYHILRPCTDMYSRAFQIGCFNEFRYSVQLNLFRR